MAEGGGGGRSREVAEAFEEAGVAYLEELLQAAVHGASGRDDPAAGRIVAGLMTALVATGGGHRLHRYLRPTADRLWTYEVTCFDSEYRPASRVERLDDVQAISTAAGLANARPAGTVSVVACDDTGHQRCVLLARGSRLSFQFPHTEEFDSGDTELRDSEPPVSTADFEYGLETDDLVRSIDSELEQDVAALTSEEIATVMTSLIPSASDIADLVVERLSSRRADLHREQRECDRRGAAAVRRPRQPVERWSTIRILDDHSSSRPTDA